MSKSEMFKSAHAQARAIVAAKGISYDEAFKYGLRRVYNQIEKDRFVQAVLNEPAKPKFMWLRGM